MLLVIYIMLLKPFYHFLYVYLGRWLCLSWSWSVCDRILREDHMLWVQFVILCLKCSIHWYDNQKSLARRKRARNHIGRSNIGIDRLWVTTNGILNPSRGESIIKAKVWKAIWLWIWRQDLGYLQHQKLRERELLALIVVTKMQEWMFCLESEKKTLIIVRELETFTYG